MASCLDTIIGIPDDCGEIQASMSGYKITDLPGISVKRMSNIADEDYITGIKLIQDKYRLAKLNITNDLVKFLQGHNYVVNTVNKLWTSSNEIKTTLAAGAVGQFRGLVIYKRTRHCALEKMYIPYVYVKANVTGEVTLRIEDGSDYYEYPIDVEAGKYLRYHIDYTAENDEVRILLPSDTAVYSVVPNCQCNNTEKSDCVTVMGISNGTTSKKQSYGIVADVQCVCDYEYLMCAIAKQVGEPLMYLTGYLIADEAIKTDRLTLETTYKDEQWEATKAEWYGKYTESFNSIIASLPNILPRIDKCGCIECGSSIKPNI